MCHKRFLHLLALHFPSLIFTTNPGGGETGLLQTLVAAAVCSVPGHNTVAAGADRSGMVDVVVGALKTTSDAALRLFPC